LALEEVKESEMEVRYDKNHHAGSGPEQRIASRLRNSGNQPVRNGAIGSHLVRLQSGHRSFAQRDFLLDFVVAAQQPG
jgi:hypothetical protein